VPVKKKLVTPSDTLISSFRPTFSQPNPLSMSTIASRLLARFSGTRNLAKSMPEYLESFVAENVQVWRLPAAAALKPPHPGPSFYPAGL
jgi:hypothetical protein